MSAGTVALGGEPFGGAAEALPERASLTSEIASLGRRSVVRIYRQPAQFVFPMVFPLMLLFINSEALASAVELPGFPADSYRSFWLANPFVFGAVTLATITGANMARDIETGFLSRLTMTPMSGPALLLGHLAGPLTVQAVNSTIYLAVGFLLGTRLESGPGGIPVIYLLALLTAAFFAATGTWLALRVGTADAVEGLFPVFFVLLFLSSSNFPRDLMTVDWFRTVATWNPISYVIEGIRSLIITGWDGAALAKGFAAAGALAVLAVLAAGAATRTRLARLTGRSLVHVATASAWRWTKNFFGRPVLFLPPLLFPLLFFTAFAGAMQGLENLPGFDYPLGYTAFQWCFTLVQGGTLSAVFVGFGVLRDFDSGFMRRLMLTAPNRLGVLGGVAITAALRSLASLAVIGTAGIVIAGVRPEWTPVGLLAAIALVVGLGQAGALWATGIAVRVRTVQGGPIIQLPIFVALFLTPVFVPVELLSGWLETAASYNPITAVLTAVRSLVAGETGTVAVAFAVVGGLVVVGAAWAAVSLRRAEHAGL